jgi:hypothetical protein
MRTNLTAYSMYQVFLNYPFDPSFDSLSYAMHFGVIAAGLLPVCAKDSGTPDRLRLEMLIDAITNCQYSVHDLSKCRGEGPENLARFNNPIEMGMALFHAFKNQRAEHRCAFFVSTPYIHTSFATDLAGLDPICHDNDAHVLVAGVYDWLRKVVNSTLLNSQPTILVQEKYQDFLLQLGKIRGSNRDGRPNHDEVQELMYRICSECGWWDWRMSKAGQIAFPTLPISLNEIHEKE